MNSFVSHPSVRIKGTENNYNPVTCIDTNCADKTSHMHCPFCVKTEFFHDPTLIKAHYRVKHVDKGLDFAGLKILRCADSCDIVGAIKGEKKFKGAHWHCYRCRNGFNRRDEALKHFKTHFRNPQTTFQIQVTQDVNQTLQAQHQANQSAVEIISQDMLGIHPALTEAVMTTTADNTFYNGDTSVSEKNSEGDSSVAANETVGTSEPTVLIQEDGTLEIHDTPLSTEQVVVVTNGNSKGSWMQQKLDFQRKIKSLEEVNKSLIRAKQAVEEKLNKEIMELKLQIQMQSNEISQYQKREEELLAQLSVNLDERMQQLLNDMHIHHQNLLHQQLVRLKREFTAARDSSESDELQTINIVSEQTKDSENGETMTVVMSVENMESDGVTHITDVTGASASSDDIITYTCDDSVTENSDDEEQEISVDDVESDTRTLKRKPYSPRPLSKRTKRH